MKGGRGGSVKRTTDAMRRGLSRAVLDLRTRMRWGQEDLAKEITKTAARMRVAITPNRTCVSRWENGDAAPSSEHRMVLAKIAAKHGHEDIAELFRAPVSAWRLVGRMRDEQ